MMRWRYAPLGRIAAALVALVIVLFYLLRH
jgi:hypothetical protein